MAKDPAFLFYHHDFIMGVAFMSMAERGAYITILCFMADKGSLSLEQIKNVCGNFDPINLLSEKFKINEKGMYYNHRLLQEVERRKTWCTTRNNNKKGVNQYTQKRSHDLSYDQNSGGHMGGHMVNVNENRNEDRNTTTKRTTPPTLDEVKSYFLERKTTVDPVTFHAHYETNGWKQASGLPIKNWKACLTTWEQRNKVFAPTMAVSAKIRPPAEVVALGCIAMKWEDRLIKSHLLDKGYTEHQADEGIMKARGNIK